MCVFVGEGSVKGVGIRQWVCGEGQFRVCVFVGEGGNLK